MMSHSRVFTRRRRHVRASRRAEVGGRRRSAFGSSRARDRLFLLGALLWSLAFLTSCGEATPPTDLPPEEEVLGVSEHAPTGDPNVSADGLVVSFDMSSVTGNGRLRDFSERGLHGLIEGTTLVETPRGEGREFRAATDRIALPDATDFDLDGPLSIVARFRFDLEQQHQHVMACDDKFVLWLNEGDRVRFANTLGDAIETTDKLTSGEWHVVIGVFRGTAGDEMSDANVELWIDGQRAAVTYRSGTGSAPFIWRQGTLRTENACFIGFENHGGDPQHHLPFNGVIDEVMVFDRALSPAEVATLSVSP